MEAEAELLAAIVSFFQRVGITAADVGIKVSNRKVLQRVLEAAQVPPQSFAQVRRVGLCKNFRCEERND